MKSRINIVIQLVAVIFFCALVTETKAQKPEDLFKEANILYNESAYDSAAAVYV